MAGKRRRLAVDVDGVDLQAQEIEVEGAEVEQGDGLDRGASGGDQSTCDIEIKIEGVVLNVVARVSEQGVVRVADSAAAGGATGGLRNRLGILRQGERRDEFQR